MLLRDAEVLLDAVRGVCDRGPVAPGVVVGGVALVADEAALAVLAQTNRLRALKRQTKIKKA